MAYEQIDLSTLVTNARNETQKIKNTTLAARNIKSEYKETIANSADALFQIVLSLKTNIINSKHTLISPSPPPSPSHSPDQLQKTEHSSSVNNKILEFIEQNNKLLISNTQELQKLTSQINTIKNTTTPNTVPIFEPILKDITTIKNSTKNIENKIDSLHTQTTATKHTQNTFTYADIARRSPITHTNKHSIIITSNNKEDTGDEIIEKIRTSLNTDKTNVQIDRIRKAKNQKVIISCDEIENIDNIQTHLKNTNLNTEKAVMKHPTIIIKDLLNIIKDEDILQLIKKQNKHIFQDLTDEEIDIQIKFTKKCRNPHLKHVVARVPPKLWNILTKKGHIYIDIKRCKIEDYSPVIQCSQCLDFGHTKKACTQLHTTCSHCGGNHHIQKCPHAHNTTPKCSNCTKANTENKHNAFSARCLIKQKWDYIARQAVQYYC